MEKTDNNGEPSDHDDLEETSDRKRTGRFTSPKVRICFENTILSNLHTAQLCVAIVCLGLLGLAGGTTVYFLKKTPPKGMIYNYKSCWPTLGPDRYLRGPQRAFLA